MRKKVLMVCSQFPPVYGGAGQQASLLASVLTERNWFVHIATLDQMRVGNSQEKNLRIRRFSTRTLRSVMLTRALSTLRLAFGSAFEVIRVRPNVVHVHGSYWWSIPSVLVGRAIGARILVKVTRDSEDDPRAVHAKRLGPLPLGWIYSMTFKCAHRVIFLNQLGYLDSARMGYGEKSVHLLNGVDGSAFRRTPIRRSDSRDYFGADKDSEVVLFVGYLVEHKGVLDLLEAWPLVVKERPGAELWLVGPNSGFYRELTDVVGIRIEELQIAGYAVRTFGHVPPTEMNRFYWAADVFTLPSYREGMPNSLAEAMVSGCAIVATRIPGITDVCPEDEAELIDPGDVAALAEGIIEALRAPRTVSSDRLRALDIASVADDYEGLYVGK